MEKTSIFAPKRYIFCQAGGRIYFARYCLRKGIVMKIGGDACAKDV